MRVINVMFDSLNRHMLSPYGCEESITPNFQRLAERTVQFDSCYVGSMPCMPARRELHTGRYNFLHRSWGPMEPFDDSMPEILKEHGIHSHLVSDHTHYWEDGGATYHNRYSTWEGFRGQEGDRWKGVVGGVSDTDPNLIDFTGYRRQLYEQDLVNRTYTSSPDEHPQVKTFRAGLEFIETNVKKDSWFLQIECFDPHEPFFALDEFRKLYPTDYKGKRFDWPDYAPVTESEEEVLEGRRNYKALLSMCDYSLGKVLDLMDKNDMWKDTMLIVNTDHGYMLGEHRFWAKNYMPMYEEISHTPLFIWNPKNGKKNERCDALVQTIDVPATVLAFFEIEKPKDMCGIDIMEILEGKEKREAALFGNHGGHICCTDGRYVYMRAPKTDDPSYEYTLMPTHMAWFFTNEELKTMERYDGFSFTKGLPVMKIRSSGGGEMPYGDLLFDLKEDPHQNMPLADSELSERMLALIRKVLQENDAPEELYQRYQL